MNPKVTGPAATKMDGLRLMEAELAQLAEDRDVKAQQATAKIVLQMRRLVEVLVYGATKTQPVSRHHE